MNYPIGVMMDYKPILNRITNFHCAHNKFIIDEPLSFVECVDCGKQLNPLWVLIRLRNIESSYNRRIADLRKIAKKAESKNSCKCQHCLKMTKIQR